LFAVSGTSLTLTEQGSTSPANLSSLVRNLVSGSRASVGAGVLVPISEQMKVELTLSKPLRKTEGDPVRNFQLGVNKKHRRMPSGWFQGKILFRPITIPHDTPEVFRRIEYIHMKRNFFINILYKYQPADWTAEAGNWGQIPTSRYNKLTWSTRMG